VNRTGARLTLFGFPDLIDAYEIFAASANGAASAARSIFGAVLPFAARPMYRRLGVAWACSLLGFVSLLMCAVPFVFIRYGDRLRANSKFCQYLQQQKRKQQEEDEAELRRKETRDDQPPAGAAAPAPAATATAAAAAAAAAAGRTARPEETAV